MCSVFLPEEDKVINISGEHLEPVEPEKGNRVSNGGVLRGGCVGGGGCRRTDKEGIL